MNDDTFARNRLMLCHFDSYSTALLFARVDTSVLLPSPLPEGASPLTGDAPADAIHEPAAALQSYVHRYGLDATKLRLVADFQEWMNTADGPIRIHLAQFTTQDAPHDVLEPHEAVFRPISQMRGTAMIELNLVRRAFNLFMGGG